MRAANAIKVHRKSGVAEWGDLLLSPPNSGSFISNVFSATLH
jgi:hypothetical protein